MTTFNLPDLGEGLAEAEIVRWHVNVGDAVKVDQPMLAVETAKAVVEVPAPFSGIVKTLHGTAGRRHRHRRAAGGFRVGRRAAQPGNVLRRRRHRRRQHAHERHRTRRNRPRRQQHLRPDQRRHQLPGGRAPAGSPNSPGGGRLRAAPAARAFAKRLGVDLAGLNGTGRGGVIIVDDVIAHSSVNARPSATARSGTTADAPNTNSNRRLLRRRRKTPRPPPSHVTKHEPRPRQRHELHAVRRRRPPPLARRPGHNHPSAARHCRGLSGRTGSKRLVRRQHPNPASDAPRRRRDGRRHARWSHRPGHPQRRQPHGRANCARISTA